LVIDAGCAHITLFHFFDEGHDEGIGAKGCP